MSTDVSPHEFEPLKRWRNKGRCRACLMHEDCHPVKEWAPARALGDKSLAFDGSVSWARGVVKLEAEARS